MQTSIKENLLPLYNTGRKRAQWVTLLLAFVFVPPCYAETDVLPGDYGALWVGFNPDTRIITGYYENYTGWDEETGQAQFSCIFYLHGKIEGDPPYRITTWYPSTQPEEIIAGQLNVSETNDYYLLSIHLDEEHGGCWNVEHFADAAAAEFTLEEESPWREIRVIAAEQAFLHDAPEAEKKTTHALVKDTAIGVLDARPGWVYTETWQDEQMIKGWIRSEDLYPDTADH